MDSSHQIDLTNIPNLPSYTLRRKKTNNRKDQRFHVIPGSLHCEKEEGGAHPPAVEKLKTVIIPRQPDTRRVGDTFPESTTQEEHNEKISYDTTVVPAWTALDKLVLRWYGFFREAVPEANLETNRLRNCIIMYYLEDDTCHIVEKKQDNSGIPQGNLIRRHRFPSLENEYLRWTELKVRGQLHVYGKSLYIHGCDPFTRAFCEENGCPQDDDEDAELDAFATSRRTNKDGSFGIPKTYEKMYNEAMLGGGHVNENLQQFLEWDGKVCRFFAVIDDVTTPQFERRPFVILYFLSDDTFEIREQYPLNCGRDSFPIFFRRGKISRGHTQLVGPFEQRPGKSTYVDISEMSVGASHTLQGQSFYIYDADPFTRAYFKENLGSELSAKADVSLPPRTIPRPPTPPYTGYGSMEDSMGSVYALNPKPPRRDLVKLYNNDGKVLRYTARFANPRPEHADRVFVVNFYLFDDTVSIHEPPARNSGIVTGRFLEKGVHANGITGQLFKIADLRPGSIIEVYNQRFEIMGMDEYTAKYLQDPEAARAYDLDTLLEKFREVMRQKFPLIRDVFRSYDLDHNGVITADEFREALNRLNIHPGDEDLLMLMRHFDTRGDGQISFNEFCDCVADEDYTTTMLRPRKGLEKTSDMAYTDRASFKEKEREETEKVRKAARDIGDVIYKHAEVSKKLMKEFGLMTHHGVVSAQQIQEALRNIGFIFELDDVVRSVLFCLPDADLSQVNYVAWIKALSTSFHDIPTR